MLKSTNSGHTALSIILLCITAWIAHFYLSWEFLLYEDDFAVMGRSMDMGTDRLWGNLKAIWTHWPHGRPLHFSLGRILSYLGMGFSGLFGFYLIGYAIICVNTILFYAFLKKIAPPVVAFCGALSFCLFPADTTKPLLTHSFMLQPGLTFLLAAFLVYMGKRPWFSYIIIIGSLITYEPTALPFLGAPLLKGPWDKKRLRAFGVHIFGIFSVLACAALVRVSMGEHRIIELAGQSLFDTLYKILTSLALGPQTIVWTFISRPFTALTQAMPWGFGAMAFFFCAYIAAIFYLIKKSPQSRQKKPAISRFSINTKILTMTWEAKIPEYVRDSMRLFGAGLFMTCAAYLLSFTYWPPMTTIGRTTCMHLAATIGGSMMFASLVWILVYLGTAYNKKTLSAVFVALYLSLLLCFHTVVQDDFAKSARLQRKFWKQVVSLCPDVRKNTVILVDPQGLAQTSYICTNFWTDRMIFELMFDFPKKQASPPRLYVLEPYLKETIRFEKNKIVWNRPIGPPQNFITTPLPEKNVIFLKMQNTGLTRVFGSISLGFEKSLWISLKPKGPDNLSGLAHRPLYDFMIENF